MKKEISIIWAYIFMSASIYGQTFSFSPYSRFGLGFLQKDGGDIPTFSMGGTNVSYFTHASLAYGNPAGISYISQSLDSMPFLFVGNIAGQFARIEGSGKVAYPFNISLHSFGVGFRVYRKLNAAVGFTPFSQIDYKIRFTDTLDTLTITNYYAGRGGLNNAWIGLGWSINNYFAIGCKLNYLFGSIINDKKIVFNAPNFLHAKIESQDYYHSLWYLPIIDLGAIGTIPLQKSWEIRLGVHYRPRQKMLENVDYHAYRYINSSGFDYIVDTVLVNDSVKGFAMLPEEWEGGIFITKSQSVGLGFQFSYTPWDKFSSFSTIDTLKPAYTISVGGFWQSSKSSVKLRHQIRWMYGFRYQLVPFEIQQKQISQMSISLGCMLPLAPVYQKLQKSWLTFGAEIGTFGTKENLRQDYLLWKFGMIFSEKWFEKRLYK